jgi:class 3 adenylate cyclase/tetratricopeptide (TPR) repeat protein
MAAREVVRVRCSNCSARNRDGAAYCVECGSVLGDLCPSCGAALESRARFCGACGARTAAAAVTASDRDGERKPVTVLFCDIVGSTALAERIGGEAMHGVLQRFFQLAGNELERFGCEVHRHLGDGFMAVLGLPRAVEDHAERAVLAGLAVRDRVERELIVSGDAGPERLRVRIGIDSGAVVIAPLGDDETAVGDTANVAARLQALAEPGQVIVGGATVDLLRGRVRTAAIGPVALRGRRAPVEAYRVIGVAPDRSAAAGLERRPFTAFVGREAPLAALVDLLDDAVEGRGHAVSLAGEPGIGKSRLVHEFRRRVADRRLTVLEGRCLSYGGAVPYAPLIEILRANAGILRSEDPGSAEDRLAAAVAEVGMDASWTPHLAGLLADRPDTDDALTPEARKAKTFEALRLLCLHGSRRRPLVLVVEDVHWIDPTSEEFLRALAADVETSAILLLTTHRPGYRPPWLSLPAASQLALRPLAGDDAERVIRSVGGAPLTEPVTAAILERAAGNPLFLEELTRATAEAGSAVGEAVPPTLHGVIAARIDRLPPDRRRLLQTAAVLGREFRVVLLELVLGDGEPVAPALEDLRRSGFLSERPGNPPVCVFKHALIQEVAEASLLSQRRERLHRAAGAALESLYAGRAAEVQDRLAYHYSRGGEPATAILHLDRLAAVSLERHAHEEAAAAVREALAHAERLPPDQQASVRLDLTIRLVDSLYFLGELSEGERLLAELAETVDRGGDPRAVARFHLSRGHALSHLGDPDGAAAAAERVLGAAPAGDDVTRGRARYVLAREAWWSGRFAEGLAHGRAASDGLERSDDRWWLAHCLCYIGHNLLYLGDVDDALLAAGRAVEVGAAAGDPRLGSFAAWSRGMYLATRGDGEAAVPECERALALSPDPANTAWAQGMLAFALAQSGRPERAVAGFQDCLGAIHRTRHRRVECWFAGWLAEAHLLSGDPAQARFVAGRALRESERVRVPWAAARALRVMGAAAAVEGDRGRARSALLTALRLQRALCAPLEAGLTALALAESRLVAGDREGAAGWASEALAGFAGRCVGRPVERAMRLVGERVAV